MKFINKATILAALLGGVTAIALTVGGVALAHGGPHGGPHGERGPWSPEKMEEHLAEMTQRLDLNDAQEASIRAIMERAQAQRQEVRDMPRGEEKFTAMKELRFATEDQIYANLSCEQREDLRLLKREHKVERMEQRFERHHSQDGN
jgi:Spy/CpxP family protein refolding chaperone